MMKQQSRNNYIRGLRFSLPLLFAAILMIFSACVDEQTPPPDNEKIISFSLSVPQNFTPQTYAIPDGVDANNKYGDAKVQTVDVLLFDKTGKYFSGPHYGSVGTTTGTDNSVDVTIRIPKDTEGAEGDFVIGVFANSRSFLNGVTFSASDNKATTLNKITVAKADGTAWDANASSGNANYIHIPMYGEGKLSSLTGGADKVKLHRMLARINVTNTYGGMPTFNFKNVYLANYNTSGHVAYTGVDGDGAPVLNATAAKGTTAITYPVTGNTCLNEIFTFEAAAGTAATIGTNPCIIIGGDYDGDGKYYYYRVDFADANGTYIPISRNHSYNVEISKIDGPGYSNLADAISSKPINIKYDVKEWNDTNIIDAAYNGQYAIGVSTAKFNFDSAARDENSGDNILYIQTNHPAGWSATIEGDDAGWLSLINLDGSAITGPVAEASSKVKLKLALNGGTEPRTATIKLTAGNVVYSVSVTQSHEANGNTVFPSEAADYIIPIGDKIFIPVSRANAYPDKGIQLGSSDVFIAELVPDSSNPDMDVISKVEPFGVGSGGHVYVEAGSVAGTAQVGIKHNVTDTEYICTWNVEVVDHIAVSGLASSYVLNGDTYSFTLYTDADFTIATTNTTEIASIAVDGVTATTGAAGFKVISFTTNPITSETSGDRRDITFTITLDGDGVAPKDVTFIGVPSIIASGLEDSYVLDGSTYTFSLETAADFTITPTSTDEIASITSSGNAGVNTISFTTKEVYSLLGNRSVTFRVTTTSGNKDITIVGSPLTFTSAPMSNSYIISPDNTNSIFIPVSQAYRACTPIPSGVDGNVGEASLVESNWFGDGSFLSELVWKDNGSIDFTHEVIGTGRAAYLRVALAQGDISQQGNAVIGIRKKKSGSTDEMEGGFLWSWHLWVVDYDPDTESTSSTSGFMSRNLGALRSDYDESDASSKGLYYQWGRKDPFPASSFTDWTSTTEPTIHGTNNNYRNSSDNTLKKVSVTGTDLTTADPSSATNTTYLPPSGGTASQNLGYAISNPHIFYYNASSPNDWYTTTLANRNNNLWGGYTSHNSLDQKTVYDPCPDGWRVPSSTKLGTNATGSGFGWYVNSSTNYSPWTSATKDNGGTFLRGYTWDGSSGRADLGGFFPASGNRINNLGDLSDVGSSGYYWSSSPHSTSSANAGSLFFYDSGVNPAYNNRRAYGCSLRCIQEL